MAFRHRLMLSKGLVSWSPVLLMEAEQWQWHKPQVRWKVGGASDKRDSANDAVDALARHEVSLASLRRSAHFLLPGGYRGSCRGSVVTALSECSPLAQAIKNPAIADGMKCVRFCREMDGNSINAPCFSIAGLVWLSACLRDALGRHQASRHNPLRHPQSTCRLQW